MSADFPGPKWSVVQVDPKWVGPPLGGKWLVYPPFAGWGEHLSDHDTWEEAFSEAVKQASKVREEA